MVNFPSKDEITQVLVENLVGEGKKIEDLSNQWFVKHLIIGLREAIYLFVVVLKLVYDQLTAVGAQEEKLEEMGYEYGIDRKQSTKAQHTVTLQKSSPVPADLPVPDNFLVTTTPIAGKPPVQFRVIAGQNKKILAGQTSVDGVKVECVVEGEVGNVPNGAINLVAQAGFDSVSNSMLYMAGTDLEDQESYRKRILERKRNPERGGTKPDYKIWAESVEGVASALVVPLARGNGTVDIIITGVDGPATTELVARVQEYIDTKTPAEIVDGGVVVRAAAERRIDVTVSNCVWIDGYTSVTGSPFVIETIESFITKTVNQDKKLRINDLIAVTKFAYDPSDQNKTPLLVEFEIVSPTANITLDTQEMATVGTITIT